jgi:hypothetical protein
LRIRSSSPLDTFVQSEINFSVGTPEILTGNLRVRLSRNDSVNVPFNTNCLNMKDRVFVVQLSDPIGNFHNILKIGTQTGWGERGTIFARIPLQASDGYGYRIRVVSEELGIIGSDNGKDIIIYGEITNNIDDGVQTYFIFPNPFDVQIHIKVSEEFFDEIVRISIYDLLGQLRINHSINEFGQAISVATNDLEDGTYLVVIETNSQRISTLMIKNSFK